MKLHHHLIIVLAAVLSLTFSVSVQAQTLGMPKGKFISYRFMNGGGMNPLNFTFFYLRHDKERGKDLLSVPGDCQGEVITVEVGEEVFEKCLEMIDKHKLYLSAGFYQPKYIIHDAPSSSFSVLLEEPFKVISGSGDMPDFIWDGINDIHRYLKTVVGDKKAEGHVDRIYDDKGFESFYWTDGNVVVPPSAKPIVALKKMVKGVTDDSDSEPAKMGYSHYKDGDQHFIMIHDYNGATVSNRLFYSFNGKEVARKQMALRDRASLLCGSYTDAQGRQFVFDAEGKCKGPNDKVAKPFISFSNVNSATPRYFWNNRVVDGFRMTEDGIDILVKQASKVKGRTKSASTKVLCHLKRANKEEDTWPIVNQRFLSQPMLDALSTEQLKQMLGNIKLMTESPFEHPVRPTDIGEVNQQMIETEINKR